MRNPDHQRQSHGGNQPLQRDWTHTCAENPLLAAGVALCREIEQLGGEALIVGGAPRALLLGVEIDDVGIATSPGVFERGIARAEDLLRHFGDRERFGRIKEAVRDEIVQRRFLISPEDVETLIHSISAHLSHHQQ